MPGSCGARPRTRREPGRGEGAGAPQGGATRRDGVARENHRSEQNERIADRDGDRREAGRRRAAQAGNRCARVGAVMRMLRRLIDLGGEDQRRRGEVLQGRDRKPGDKAGDEAGRQNARNQARWRLVAGEGERVARVMRRVMDAFWIGEAREPNEPEAESERNSGGLQRLESRSGEGGGVGG